MIAVIMVVTLVSSRTELRFSTQTVSTGPSKTIQNQALQCCKYGGFDKDGPDLDCDLSSSSKC